MSRGPCPDESLSGREIISGRFEFGVTNSGCRRSRMCCPDEWAVALPAEFLDLAEMVRTRFAHSHSSLKTRSLVGVSTTFKLMPPQLQCRSDNLAVQTAAIFVSGSTDTLPRSSPSPEVLQGDPDMPCPRGSSAASRSQATAHELGVLKGSRALVYHVPVATLPEKSPQREDYIDRTEFEGRLAVARATPLLRHLERVLIIGWFSGTRPGAILRLCRPPSTSGGHVDLDHGSLCRPRQAEQETSPPCHIHTNLVPYRRLAGRNGDAPHVKRQARRG